MINLLVLCNKLSYKQKAGIVSNLLLEHTKTFSFFTRLQIFVLRLMYGKTVLYQYLNFYYTKNHSKTDLLFSTIVNKIMAYENCELMQDFMVSLHEENWSPFGVKR